MSPNVTSLIPGVPVSSLFVDKLSKNVGSATGTKRKPYLRLFITPNPARDVSLQSLAFVLNAKIIGRYKQTYRLVDRFPFGQNKVYQRRLLGRMYVVILIPIYR